MPTFPYLWPHHSNFPYPWHQFASFTLWCHYSNFFLSVTSWLNILDYINTANPVTIIFFSIKLAKPLTICHLMLAQLMSAHVNLNQPTAVVMVCLAMAYHGNALPPSNLFHLSKRWWPLTATVYRVPLIHHLFTPPILYLVHYQRLKVRHHHHHHRNRHLCLKR